MPFSTCSAIYGAVVPATSRFKTSLHDDASDTLVQLLQNRDPPETQLTCYFSLFLFLCSFFLSCLFSVRFLELIAFHSFLKVFLFFPHCVFPCLSVSWAVYFILHCLNVFAFLILLMDRAHVCALCFASMFLLFTVFSFLFFLFFFRFCPFVFRCFFLFCHLFSLFSVFSLFVPFLCFLCFLAFSCFSLFLSFFFLSFTLFLA